ncbi:MAG: xanthine dehydrogenase family protein subunit M [Nitrososphaerota archaeon]|nr:xanthine dehydrogenase family protein subunit M [Nitrososphaerota archaeon]
MLEKYGEEAKVLAGGQSLIPMMKLRLLQPEHVIDLNNIPDLSYIEDRRGSIAIGALARHSDLERSPLIREKLPIIGEAAEQIADQQVRNLGTMAGSACHADPAADWPAVLQALDASFVVRGKDERVVPATQFFRGPFDTVVRQGEIMTEIDVPVPQGDRVGQTYLKFERRAGDFATVGVAAVVCVGGDGAIASGALALSAVAPAAYRATDAEKIMEGKKPTQRLIEEAASAAAAPSSPASDLRGSAEYKKEMARVFVRRALKTALERAGVKL